MLPVPATIVSGFLGAGKTTLVNNILSGDHGLSIAVIVNDVGAINIDAELLAGKSDGIVSLKNGCVCCSMRPDLVQHVGELVAEQRPDHIVIEASGVSEPGNIVRTLGYPELDEAVFVNAVVTVVDAELFPGLAGASKYLANEQLAEADVVVVNKSDLVSADTLDDVVSRCTLPGTFVYACSFADVPAALLFYDSKPERQESTGRQQLRKSPLFESRTWEPAAAVDVASLRQAIDALPPEVFRVKGFVTCSATGRNWLLQKVGTRTIFHAVSNAHDSALVLIGERGTVDWNATFRTLNSIASLDDGRPSAGEAVSPPRSLRA